MDLTLEKASRQPHVLLADGDEVTAFAVRTLLQQCGYRVTMAKSGQEALNIFRSAQRQRVDLVLTDHLLPKCNSLEVAAEVTSSKEVPTVPVIVMSDKGDQELMCKAFQSGAVDYLQKPIRHNEVVTLWRHLWKTDQRPQSCDSAKVDFSPNDCFTMDTSRLDGRGTCGGSSQEEGSSCEMQSSCTIAAPAAKRARAESPDTAPLMSLDSFESSALTFLRGQQALVGESEKQLPASTAAHTSTAEHAVGWSQVLPGRPHEAPVFSCTEPGSRAAFARVLSCPSMLAAQAAHHPARDTDTEATRKPPYEHPLSSEDAAAPSLEPTDGDASEDSAATAKGAAYAAVDASPFAAFCKLSGPEGLAVTSSVHLEIAPLDLTPWPSTTSSVGRLGSMGRQSSLAPQLSVVREHTQEQVPGAAASLCELAKAFAAAVPWPGPRAAPPLLQPLKVSASLELSSEMSKASHRTAADGSCSFTGLKQAGPFGKAPKGAADLHSMAVQGGPAVWAANRRAALERLREKKKLRSFRKKVRYESRRLLAESRPRIRGQFVKASAEAAA